MIKRATILSVTVASALFAGQAKADYTVTLSNLSPQTTTNFNGTSYILSIPAPVPQTGSDGFTQGFNIINVAEPTAALGGMGSINVSEDFSITGTNGTAGSVSGTLNGTFSVTGALYSFNFTNFTNLTGTGFNVGGFQFSQASPGSTAGSSNSGNISFIVTPTAAVPEPASFAMLGLGLLGAAGVSAYRRRSAK